MRKSLIVIAATVVLASCGQETGQTSAEPPGAVTPRAEPEAEPATATDPMAAAAALAGEWRLVSIGGEAPPTGLERPTLTVLSDGKVAGFAGVNRFSGRFGGPEGRVFGPMPTTMMAGPPAAMALEADFLGAMVEATGYQLDGEALTLSADRGELVFERAQ